MKRSANCGGPSPNAYIYITASADHRKLAVSRVRTLQGAEDRGENCQKESGSPVHSGQVQTTDTQTTTVDSADGVYIFLSNITRTCNIYNICTYRYMYVTVITKVGAGRYWLKNRRNMGEIGRKGKKSSM